MKAALALGAILLAACAAASAPTLPPIPASVPSALGPVAIVWQDTLRGEQGQLLIGGFSPFTRSIYLSRSLTHSLVAAHQVLAHERCHVALFDAGIRVNTPTLDTVCDALATARVAEMLRGVP